MVVACSEVHGLAVAACWVAVRWAAAHELAVGAS